MKRFIYYRYLRLLVQIEIRRRKITYDSHQQERAVKITEKLIRDHRSELLMAPLSDSLYIKHKNLFIVIGRSTINIINGKYNYDIQISDKIHDQISYKFKKKLEHRRMEMETQITSKVETILDSIFYDIN